MKKYFLIALVLLIHVNTMESQSLERHWKAGNYEKVRVMSYNIFNGFDWGKDTDRINRFVDYIEEQDPEVLALQELCGFTPETLQTLAEKYGHPYTVLHKEGGYSVGITSKKPIKLVKKLTEGYGHGLLHVETYNHTFLVTHLNPSSDKIRLKEANNITEYMAENKLTTKTLLMGDLNAVSPFDADYLEQNRYDSPNDYSVISQFLSAQLYDICRVYVPREKRLTFPTAILIYNSKNRAVQESKGSRIDYIFGTKDMLESITDAYILNENDSDYLSDHYPIAIDFVYTGEEGL